MEKFTYRSFVSLRCKVFYSSVMFIDVITIYFSENVRYVAIDVMRKCKNAYQSIFVSAIGMCKHFAA